MRMNRSYTALILTHEERKKRWLLTRLWALLRLDTGQCHVNHSHAGSTVFYLPWHRHNRIRS